MTDFIPFSLFGKTFAPGQTWETSSGLHITLDDVDVRWDKVNDVVREGGTETQDLIDSETIACGPVTDKMGTYDGWAYLSELTRRIS